MTRSNWIVLVGFVLGTEAAGAIGSLVTVPAIGGWYATLAKPALVPPNGIFGPVWTTLYVLIGSSVFLIWKKYREGLDTRKQFRIFWIQLVLNMLWPIVFFGLHSIAGGMITIVALWLSILAMVIAFAKVSTAAAWLLGPYILWVTFASYLNGAIWILN